MATSNPSGFDGPVRKTLWWRRRWSTGERVWAALLIVLVLILVWVGLKKPETVTIKPASTTVTETKTTTVTGAASGPATTVPGRSTVTSVATATVTAQVTPVPTPAAPVVLPPPAAPKAQASAPQTATKVEQKKTERKVAKPETSPQQSATKPSAPKTASTAVQAAPTGKPFAWSHVGGDPCNPKAGCTLAWALEQSKWPADVQSALMAKVRGESPSDYTMRSGWNGWMTWGQYERKFRSNTVAAWPSGHKEQADLWSVNYANLSYNLVRVQKCKNWGGFTTSGPAPMRPAGPASPDVMPLGVIPTVACPD